MSMANSIEVRVPLLDHCLAEFAFKVNKTLKVKNRNGKYLMRKALEKYLPHNLINRPKKGFSIPIGDWFRKELKGMTHDLLFDGKLRQRGYFNENGIRQLVDDHMKCYSDNKAILWLLLNFELWHRKFIG